LSPETITYPLRHRIALGAALFHLALVGLGASYLGYSHFGKLAPALDYYGELSGAGFTYGFFAPGIYDQLRAIFEITDPAGRTRRVDLATGASHEADLRVGNIIDQFAEDADRSMEFQRSLSSSLAGTIFGRYADARQVKVILEEFHPVSMRDYRSGGRPHWAFLYSAKFEVSRRKSP
jgi:hypothetical protein